jgi:hypothetical protein
MVEMNSTLKPSTDWLFILCMVILVLYVVALIVYFGIKYWNSATAAPAAAPEAAPEAAPAAEVPEYWCFVGEDLTGRWCVKTPEDGLCPKDRSFRRRADCERVTASASPLGVNQQHDTTMIPIAGLSIA